MKRLAVIILLLFLFFGISLAGSAVSELKAQIVDEKLEKIYVLANGQEKGLFAAVEELEEFWEKNEVWFVLVTNHKLTDELEENVKMLKYYLGINEQEHLLAEIGKCRSLLVQIKIDDKLSSCNIL